jgi:hypothetical protein
MARSSRRAKARCGKALAFAVARRESRRSQLRIIHGVGRLSADVLNVNWKWFRRGLEGSCKPLWRVSFLSSFCSAEAFLC